MLSKLKQLFHKPAHKMLMKHETKQHALFKFLLVLFVLISYFLLISFKYGLQEGIIVTALTWSFFVMCTPISDAGFLIDFPLRLITKFRMFYSELIVWGIAILLNLYTFFLNPAAYQKTKLLNIFYKILSTPIPFWSIILISAVGTFLSIQFADELVDKASHKDRTFYHQHKYNYRLILMFFIFLVSVIIYSQLLKQLNLDLSVANLHSL